ncbi:helicase-related protein [Clostridium cibarium]|uniref:helicase-related protein n=1 Tax=Clostridium cibarium TaxID=2762247 RepID=UPI00311A9ABA
MEFINKQSAYNFYRSLKEDEDFDEVQLMTGDDNTIERKRILKLVKEKKSIILVSTQVVEAGVDIDMDIGYKDISKLDSDEQFMGRINRSCKKDGTVYFFNLDKMESIYKNDIRANKSLSLLDENMKEILVDKNFESYYKPVIEKLKEDYNESFSETNIEDFFVEIVGNLKFKDVETRMRLIEDDRWHMSVYLSSEIKKDDGTILDGKAIWEEYEELLKDNKLSYSEKEVKLSRVRSLMNNFIYEIMKCDTFPYTQKIGELYYIENGDKYFDDGKLNKERFISGVGDFIEI